MKTQPPIWVSRFLSKDTRRLTTRGLNEIKVTPDPGVIEVNTNPVETWDDLVRNTNILYEEARLTRLGTEKFMLDGRHTGTGGGNHIVIGGASPADSPTASPARSAAQPDRVLA